MKWNMRAVFVAIGISMWAGPVTSAVSTEWKEHKAPHFVIYYKDAPLDFIKTVEDAAEGYYRDITKNLGFTRFKSWSWDERAKIFIFSDADDYVKNANMARWSHGAASARHKTIMTFPAAHGFFDSTLPHELGHIIFREFIGFTPVVPVWFEEGVAMYQEKAKRWGANKIAKQAITDGTFMNIPELSRFRLTHETSQEQVELFYTEAASIVYYMIQDLGEYKFMRFSRELRDGLSFENALKSAYGRFETLEDLNRSWVHYLQRKN